MIDRYLTSLSAVVVPRAVPLGDTGRWITQTSLLDPAPNGPGLAHLMPAGSAEIARRHGARLPTQADMLALHIAAAAAGSEIAPATMPDSALAKLGFKPGDAQMSSRLWCDHADPIVLARIAALGDLADRAVSGDLKIWTYPLGSLCGWWVPDVHAYDETRPHGPGFIQAGGHVVHLAGRIDPATGEQVPLSGQYDYGSGTKLVWDSDPAELAAAA